MKYATNGVMAMIAVLIALGGARAPAVELLNVGLQKHLLVDDYALAGKVNVGRRMGQVTKVNGGQPIMVQDRDWESGDWGLFGFYGSVLHDGEKFRMWYSPWRFAIAYAESTDGVNWQKPELGLYDFSVERANNDTQMDGNSGFYPRADADPNYTGTDNNIVGIFGDGFTAYLDPHETDPDHRYKAAYGHMTQISAVLAHSPDGISWTPYNNGQPVTGRASDSYNQVVWDENANTYRLYTRSEFNVGDIEVRGNRGMVNPDIKTNPTGWKTVRGWKFDREGNKEYERRQLYSLTDWIHEGIHFALMQVYEWPDQPPRKRTGGDVYKRHEQDVSNFYIGTSRDGDNWDLSWVYAGEPLVPRGPDGSFDKDMIFPSSSIVTWQDKHWIYYGGFRERHWQFGVPHKSAIGLATLPLDRFVGLQAGQKTGSATTRPFKLAGGRLILNADTREGNIRVAVLDQAGQPIEGFSVRDCRVLKCSDDLRAPVKWEGPRSLADLKGQVIRLRFILGNATLYAFEVQP